MNDYYNPTRQYNDAVDRAIDRDLIDSERLKHFEHLVDAMLDALIPDAHDMSHPRARWHPTDLVDVLQGQARSIRWELDRLRGPLVLDNDP